MPEAREVIEAREHANDKNYYEEIIKTMPLLIEWANDEIKDDKNILLEAIKVDSGALEFASNRLKDDKDVLLASVARGRLDGLLCV